MRSEETSKGVETCLGCVLGLSLAFALDFLVVCGLYWLCCWAFSLQFNWKYAVVGSVLYMFALGIMKSIARSVGRK